MATGTDTGYANAWLSPAGAQGENPTNMGSNQYASYPNINPTQGPSSGSLFGGGSTTNPLTGPGQMTNTPGGIYQFNKGQTVTNPTYDPGFTTQFFNFLSGQGGSAASGILQQLTQFLNGQGTSTPGGNQLQQMAQTGDPVNQTPAWQAMIQSENQNTQQNMADVQEQFAGQGSLGGSEYGTALANLMAQINASQNAQLTAATTAEGDQAANRQLSAGQGIQSESTSMDQFLTSLLSSGATAAPGTSTTAHSSVLGGIGSLLGAAAGAIPGLGELPGIGNLIS